MIRKEISLLPGSGPSQQLEARLGVPGEDYVSWGAKDPVAQNHLQIKRKQRGDPEESLGVRVGCPLVDDHEGIGVVDHQGKEVTNEVFPQSWLAAESMSHSHRIALVVINQVGTEGAIGFLSLLIFVRVVGSPRNHPSSLLSSSLAVE